MNVKQVGASVAVIAVLGAAGIATGEIVGNRASASVHVGDKSTTGAKQAAPAQAPKHKVFAKNAKGLSYGSIADAATPADDPDLVLVVATNGKSGYVYDKQLNVSPSSPEKAEALTDQNKEGRTIPVYEQDGKTKVGVFTIGGDAQ